METYSFLTFLGGMLVGVGMGMLHAVTCVGYNYMDARWRHPKVKLKQR